MTGAEVSRLLLLLAAFRQGEMKPILFLIILCHTLSGCGTLSRPESRKSRINHDCLPITMKAEG